MFRRLIFFENRSSVVFSPHGVWRGCSVAKMSGSVANINNFKFFFDGKFF